jgi:hypothetical protein
VRARESEFALSLLRSIATKKADPFREGTELGLDPFE